MLYKRMLYMYCIITVTDKKLKKYTIDTLYSVHTWLAIHFQYNYYNV